MIVTVKQLIKKLQKLPQEYKIDIPRINMDDGELYQDDLFDLIVLEDVKMVSLLSDFTGYVLNEISENNSKKQINKTKDSNLN